MIVSPMVFMSDNKEATKIVLKSPLDGVEKGLVVPFSIDRMNEAIEAYDDGLMIQYAFSFLDANQRDFMLTGILPEDSDTFYDKINPEQ